MAGRCGTCCIEYGDYLLDDLREKEVSDMVHVEEKLCIGCGQCEQDCFPQAISIKNGKARWIGACMECGHCVAVCPMGAVSMDGAYDMTEVLPYDAQQCTVSPKNLLYAMKCHRSIRQYQCKAVEQEKLERIVEAGRYTPTASNRQDVHFVVVQKELEQIKALIWEGIDRLIQFNAIPQYQRLLQSLQKKKQSVPSKDALFFDAPVLVVLTCSSPWNGQLAARSMELMAQAEGLGTLYSGFIQSGLNHSPQAQECLGITGESIAACMLIGYPKVAYYRTVPRKPANVTWK